MQQLRLDASRMEEIWRVCLPMVCVPFWKICNIVVDWSCMPRGLVHADTEKTGHGTMVTILTFHNRLGFGHLVNLVPILHAYTVLRQMYFV